MHFEIIGPVREPVTIAVGKAIRELPRLQRVYGKARWRKRKGTAQVLLGNASVRTAELHWYEASGIGRREYKIKRFLD